MQKNILLTLNNRIAIITLVGPEKCNALNEALTTELLQTLRAVEKNPAIQVVILQGSGKHFCAGADLNWLMGSQSRKAVALLKKLFSTLHTLSKPSIALVQGHVYGGGLGLVASSDITISSTEAIFCFSEVKLGLIPAIIAPYCITAMGQRAASYYFLSAEHFNADEAYRTNLIQKIISEENLYNTGLELAKKIANNSPEAIKSAKKLIHAHSFFPNKKFSTQTKDAPEGFKAFIEKRAPHWIK